MKSTFFLCVIFVLVACSFCSPAKKAVNSLKKAVASQQRTRRSLPVDNIASAIAGIADIMEEVPNTRNRRSSDELMNSLKNALEEEGLEDVSANNVASNLISESMEE
ncbi:unnamed protein product [Porites evermanni]|uniref:Uncharacterized protein n=1 Tax=Porites evermanni TaxID=104178 RepID=A0ABN8LIK8_9CNID|nr:unnamed protein product [Porites evermanni]